MLSSVVVLLPYAAKPSTPVPELPLTVQSVSVRRAIACGHAAGRLCRGLPLTVQLVSVSVPPWLYRPPPPLPDATELPLTVQSVSVVVPEFHRPPPLCRRSCR